MSQYLNFFFENELGFKIGIRLFLVLIIGVPL